jgi:hypothetical protein
VLYNIDIGVPGQTVKRPGSVLIGNDIGDISPVLLHNFEIQGDTDQLLMYENTTLWKWVGTGNWSSIKADFTAATSCGILSAKESGLTPDDVVIVQNGTDNAFRIDSAGNAQDLGNTNTSPPVTTVMAWFNNRVWCLLNDLLYFSTAYPSDYSAAFDRTTNSYRIPVGEECAIIATRDYGMLLFGKSAVWALNPSTVPVATDKPEPVITEFGAVSKNAVVAVGDDVYFFAPDGLRSLKRTVQDKLQLGADYPLSHRLKAEYENISWAYIDRVCMEHWDNKLFITVPTSSTGFDTWVYYPALDAFMVIQGWSPRCWEKYKINGQEFLYYGLSGQGKVYRAWYGYTDEGTTTIDGTAINYQEEGRKDDFGQPLVKKCGGTVRLKGYVSGDYDVNVYAKIDDQSWILLGVLNLKGDSPTLPVSLPFTLSDKEIIEDTFHLDSLGEWYTLQLKLVHNATTGNDEIKILSREITTFQQEYYDE